MHENKNVPIHFTSHALDSARKRGTNQTEIQMPILGATWRAAKLDRAEAEMEFDYSSEWNGQYYQFKKVNPVFVVEYDQIIVVTVYCFYY